MDSQTAKIFHFKKKLFKALEKDGIKVNLYVDEELRDSKQLIFGDGITSYCAYGGYAAGINIIYDSILKSEIMEISNTFCEYDYGIINFVE